MLWEKFKAEIMRAKGKHLLRPSPWSLRGGVSCVEEEMAVMKRSGYARLVLLL